MPAASSSLCFYFIFLVGSSTSFSIFVFLFSFPSASPLIPSGIPAKTHIEADSEVFFILSFSRLFDSIFSFSFVRSFFFFPFIGDSFPPLLLQTHTFMLPVGFSTPYFVLSSFITVLLLFVIRYSSCPVSQT